MRGHIAISGRYLNNINCFLFFYFFLMLCIRVIFVEKYLNLFNE